MAQQPQQPKPAPQPVQPQSAKGQAQTVFTDFASI